MSNELRALERLVSLIQVERIAEDQFRGESEDIGTRAVFGGQVLGQALLAASSTVSPERKVHSVHSYFLLPGKHAPIDYSVVHTRDGRSFSNRRVEASQEGATIFELLASYQEVDQGFDRHDPKPSVPGPEGIVSERELRAAIADQMPEQMRGKLRISGGIDFRPVIPFEMLNAKPREAKKCRCQVFGSNQEGLETVYGTVG